MTHSERLKDKWKGSNTVAISLVRIRSDCTVITNNLKNLSGLTQQGSISSSPGKARQPSRTAVVYTATQQCRLLQFCISTIPTWDPSVTFVPEEETDWRITKLCPLTFFSGITLPCYQLSRVWKQLFLVERQVQYWLLHHTGKKSYLMEF